MQATQETTLWDLIGRLGQAMPLSKAAFEQAIGAQMQLKSQTEHALQWVSPPLALSGGVSLSLATLLLGPDGSFDQTSAASLEIAGPCIRIDEAKQRFPGLAITQPPRGRSVEETTVYEARQPWGRVSFAVKAAQSDCVVRVAFRR